ncbi:UDP-N-acetylglucosamine:LPS N-acetylglucosamine transferase [Rhizobium sp. SG_E_25_P2]|nr:UDP-N-acetylglucosamine:LPS N-acetylglucosamine transferase [Rhizobium sp. SG_E_25_P2]
MTMQAPSKTHRIEIFYFDAGGGHRNAMTALTRLIEKTHPNWAVTPVDLQKLLEPVDPVHRLTQKITGSLKRILLPVAPRLPIAPIQAQDIYNNALKRGATRGLGTILPILQGFIRRYSADIERLLAARWRAEPRPDLVVSVIPNFNRVMHRALQTFDASIPYLTVITDLVDAPPHFWMEDQAQYIVCGTPKAAEQARATGFYRDSDVFEVSGMILKDAFYQPPAPHALTRSDLALAEDRSTAMIMFGGNGARRATLTILDQLEKSATKVQSIVMCGKNTALQKALQGRPNCCAVGFVQNVPDYMRLADFLIGKPGPGSISEAVHLGRPVIVEGNASTMPQERPNLDWIRNNGVGLVVKSFRKEIAGATERMLADLPRFQDNIARNLPENRAVFETVEIIGRILDETALDRSGS